jgi:uncharacterized GH25 family protein
MSEVRALLLLIGFGIACEGHAHEFWVQPGEFQIAPGAVLSLALQVGDGGMRQRSPIPLHRITRFEAIGPNGDAIDMRTSLAATAKRDVLLDVPGTYVLALATDNRAYSRQSAERFNAYLETEGLTPALEYRARTHQMHVDGFERYSRAAKSIVLVGASSVQSQPHVTQPLGLPLEIVPVVNPYGEPRPTSFPVRVLYDGQVLPGALVKLSNLEQGLAPVDARRSDKFGLVTFTMPQTGSWLVSVVWTKRLENSSEADFETVFASLTFGLGSSTSAPASAALRRRTRGCSRPAGSSDSHPETPAGGSRSSGAGAPTSIPACC